MVPSLYKFPTSRPPILMPVACASYRLLPQITIKSPITGEDAAKFSECFSPGVIECKELNGVKTATVKNPRYDTVSRECLRHREFDDKVILSRVHDHFICTQLLLSWLTSSIIVQIETTGFFDPVDTIRQGLYIIAEKCARLKNSLSDL